MHLGIATAPMGPRDDQQDPPHPHPLPQGETEIWIGRLAPFNQPAGLAMTEKAYGWSRMVEWRVIIERGGTFMQARRSCAGIILFALPGLVVLSHVPIHLTVL